MLALPLISHVTLGTLYDLSLVLHSPPPKKRKEKESTAHSGFCLCCSFCLESLTLGEATSWAVLWKGLHGGDLGSLASSPASGPGHRFSCPSQPFRGLTANLTDQNLNQSSRAVTVPETVWDQKCLLFSKKREKKRKTKKMPGQVHGVS